MGATRIRRRRTLLRATLALVLLGALVMTGIPGRDAPTSAEGADGVLALRGRATGLYPGAARPLRVLVRNRSDRAVQLTRLTSQVIESPPGCPPEALRAGEPETLPLVPASGRARVVLPIELLPSAPDACQGGVFRLRFRAAGETAGEAA